MTATRRQGLQVRAITDGDRPALDELVGREPLVNAVIASRLAAISTLAPFRFGGQLLGAGPTVDEVSGCPATALRAAAFHGGNLLPIGGDVDSWVELASFCAARPRVCTSIVGTAAAVAVWWSVLEPQWGPARDTRFEQPLLSIERRPPSLIDQHPGLQVVRPEQIDSYLLAAVAMFSEELGVSPFVDRSGEAYRRRVEALLRGGRAFAVTDSGGQVVFKADIGALSAQTCQIHGVWVRPDLRGRGLGRSALAAVIDYALTLAPSVSLYVNAFNEPAQRMYATLGMRRVATLSTILF